MLRALSNSGARRARADEPSAPGSTWRGTGTCRDAAAAVRSGSRACIQPPSEGGAIYGNVVPPSPRRPPYYDRADTDLRQGPEPPPNGHDRVPERAWQP